MKFRLVTIALCEDGLDDFSFENGSKHNRNVEKKTVTTRVLTTQTYPLFMICHYLSPGLYLCVFSRLHKYMKT